MAVLSHGANDKVPSISALWLSPAGAVDEDGAGFQSCRHSTFVLLTRRREGRHDPCTKLWINYALLEQMDHSVSREAMMSVEPVAEGHHPQRILPSVCKKLSTQPLGMLVNVNAQLGEDGKPDIVRSDCQVVMVAVRQDGPADEAI